MAQVELKPTNKRLKQVIKEFDRVWDVIKVEPMQCFNGRTGVQIKSKCGKHLRNVELSDVIIIDEDTEAQIETCPTCHGVNNGGCLTCGGNNFVIANSVCIRGDQS